MTLEERRTEKRECLIRAMSRSYVTKAEIDAFDRKTAQMLASPSSISDAPVYSGRVLKNHPNGPDLLLLQLYTDEAGDTDLRIESAWPLPVRVLLELNKAEASALHRCLHNALERWNDATYPG